MAKIKTPKKLIEVALPLDDISIAASREKSIRHGHPSTLHLWWARRPLAAARAVIFAQMVNDPAETIKGDRRLRDTKEKIQNEREELFKIIRELVQWENTNNEAVLNKARKAIKESWHFTCELNKNHPQADELFNPEKLPAFHDPFAGGGALPLEAQRLGLDSYASDLNPVAVMINKAMIEIPPKFAEQKPIGPLVAGEKQSDFNEKWLGASGLAEDVRRYGHWIKEEAFKRIGHLYPKVLITTEIVQNREDLKPYLGKELTVIAWLWARTVRSPNPAFSHVDVPLVRSFVLSSKKNKEVWVEPVIENDHYRFQVRIGKQMENALDGTVSKTGATCILSNTPIPLPYIRTEAKTGRMRAKLMAVVLEGIKGRIYLSPTPEMQKLAENAKPENIPESQLPKKALGFRVQEYGMLRHRDLFTLRQLVALSTFSDLVQEARIQAIKDAKVTGMADDDLGIDASGQGATAYGDALATFLAFAIDKMADLGNSLVRWEPVAQCPRQLFGRQAIPMVWDFAEANIFSSSSGSFLTLIDGISKSFAKTFNNTQRWFFGNAQQADATFQSISKNKVISSDPPYYDNIGYADLSDFFYIWMRRSMKAIYPNLFTTIAVPKEAELVATPYRHETKEKAEKFFLDGMTQAIHNMAEKGHPAFPVSIYYAFKQSETKEGNTASTGWETFLEAVISAGFSIDGTWPLRTENRSRLVSQNTNALASSVVLVCRKREAQAGSISRRQFQRELREHMPEALYAMIGGTASAPPISPVDLAQAAIGPGMAIYSKHDSILEADGSKMKVHDALILINRAITEYLNPDSGNFDSDTLFCDDWFSQYGWNYGPFDDANTLAMSKGISVDGVQEAGVIESGSGKVRLLKWGEYPSDWNPKSDSRIPVWEACHQMIRALKTQGEYQAGSLLALMPDRGEQIRQLAYHLYTLCERKKWAEDARAYSELIGSWHVIVLASQEAVRGDSPQQEMDF